ncbi:MAG: phosphate acyltransferase PlsX [Myxococcales bacterium]|nr:phosphate acyltransferase PlsX [Myxococcales bacterium]
MGLLIDAMNGEHAPEAPIRAAALLSLDRDLDLCLVGDEAVITEQLSSLSHDPSTLMVLDAAPGDDPGAASLDRAMELLHAPGNSALITAADGADVSRAARQRLPRIPGVPSAALCAVYPTARRRGDRGDPFSLILDVGASQDATAADLIGFAHMGSAYASRISGNTRPKIGLMASRSDLQHAPESVREAAARLREDNGVEFIGGVGGVDIGRGAADVVVCQGSTGAVVIDLLLGVPGLVQELIRSTHDPGLTQRLTMSMIKRELRAIRSLTDWKGYGGAPLLGFERAVITTDPAGSVETFRNAIRLAAKSIRKDIIGAIRAHFTDA